jgi:ATP-dependent Lon protease
VSKSQKSIPPKPSAEEKELLPILPLKDLVVFPRMVMPLLVGRPRSVAAVEEALASGRPLFLCAQKDASIDAPTLEDMYGTGTAASVLQTLRMPDGTMKVVVEGLGRASMVSLEEREDFTEAGVREIVEESDGAVPETSALMRAVTAEFEKYSKLSGRVAPEIVGSLQGVDEPAALCDLVCAYLPLNVDERQELLSVLGNKARLERISETLIRETELLDIEQRVRERIREQMDRSQREYYLHEQLKAIHQELGTKGEGTGDEFADLRDQIEKTKMPKDVREKAFRELGRYERTPTMSPESTVIRTYLEWLIDLPWQKRTRDKLDLKVAQKVLDEDHYGLEKVKERILDFLAVRKLSKSTRGPILCLVGPPGVGKTSLGKSIAQAMGRKFVRVSLGGVRDEAEIRGHRRTYIGSLPGRVIQSMKKAGVKNPVFILDEIDKMSADFRGDPSSALLEVLDPEQNDAFSDHYLEVDFDLSEVFFVTTANSEYDIPEALHDRMEVVRLSGYTPFEKARIAKLFLIPKQTKASGLTKKSVKFTDKGVDYVINRYTREAGVRELERQIANLCRKVARKVVTNNKLNTISITEKKVVELLGPEEYSDVRADAKPLVGVAVGLAWTPYGGEILTIETSLMKGKGDLNLTGQLGDVMKESAHAAYTYLRSHAKELGIRADFYARFDMHVHVPEGAIPKDGPSAGTAMAVSMLSALRKEAPAERLAMTGEITLRGLVLPIGGVKEKVLAAHQAGIRTILMPKENEKDLKEVPKEISRDIEFHFVGEIGEVFTISFPKLAKPARKRKPKASAKKTKPKRRAKRS